MTKEEILAQMQEKYDISDSKMDEYLKPNEVTQPEACSIDDPECLTCGS
jgi:hypothetical protein